MAQFEAGKYLFVDGVVDGEWHYAAGRSVVMTKQSPLETSSPRDFARTQATITPMRYKAHPIQGSGRTTWIFIPDDGRWDDLDPMEHLISNYRPADPAIAQAMHDASIAGLAIVRVFNYGDRVETRRVDPADVMFKTPPKEQADG